MKERESTSTNKHLDEGHSKGVKCFGEEHLSLTERARERAGRPYARNVPVKIREEGRWA